MRLTNLSEHHVKEAQSDICSKNMEVPVPISLLGFFIDYKNILEMNKIL